jgi:hypothetical protein
MKNEECLTSPAARPGEGERRTVSFKTILFCSAQNSGPLFFYIYIYILFLLILFVGIPKNGLQQMPPFYNAYGAGVLHSKFYKDKQN